MKTTYDTQTENIKNELKRKEKLIYNTKKQHALERDKECQN